MLGTGFGTSYGGIDVQAQWRKGDIRGYGVHAGLGFKPKWNFKIPSGTNSNYS